MSEDDLPGFSTRAGKQQGLSFSELHPDQKQDFATSRKFSDLLFSRCPTYWTISSTDKRGKVQNIETIDLRYRVSHIILDYLRDL